MKRRRQQEHDEEIARDQAEARRDSLLAELRARQAAPEPEPEPPPAESAFAEADAAEAPTDDDDAGENRAGEGA